MARKISTFALDAEIQAYATVSDARSFTFQQMGHLFYVLTFPAADKTWVFDASTEQWTEWTWTDDDGHEHAHRAACCAFWNGQHIVGDRANGNLYVLDPNAFTDAGQPIVRRRGLPHMMDSGNRLMYREFIADFEVGNEPSTGKDADSRVYLRWSDTRGKTWGNPVAEELGPRGYYERSMQWQRLGLSRGRVFELFWSAPVKTALNGAFVRADASQE